MKINDELIEKIKPYFKNIKAYLTGGYIRDYLSQKYSKDRDITVLSENLETICKKMADELGGSFVELDSVNKIYRVVFGEDYIDFAKTENNSLNEDTDRRDFTINAIMYDISSDEIIDKNNGIEDFKNKIIRTKRIENLSYDYIRMLRAFRFQAQLGFKTDENILEFIKNNSSKIRTVAPERIRQELLKMFEGEYITETLLDMEQTGLLYSIFPIFNEIKKIPKNSHHHLPLFYHLVETVKNIRINKPELKLAAFLHDIGKPSTWTIEDTGRHRFIGHDKEGSNLVIPILKGLKFSNKEINYISKMIKYHIYPSSLMAQKEKSKNALIRFVRKIDEDTIDLIELARADRLAAQGEAISENMIKENLDNLEELKKFYIEIQPKLKTLPKLIDGFEIMEILQIPPSPKLKEIIEEIKEKQLEGAIKTKDEAIEFLRTKTPVV